MVGNRSFLRPAQTWKPNPCGSLENWKPAGTPPVVPFTVVPGTITTPRPGTLTPESCVTETAVVAEALKRPSDCWFRFILYHAPKPNQRFGYILTPARKSTGFCGNALGVRLPQYCTDFNSAMGWKCRLMGKSKPTPARNSFGRSSKVAFDIPKSFDCGLESRMMPRFDETLTERDRRAETKPTSPKSPIEPPGPAPLCIWLKPLKSFGLSSHQRQNGMMPTPKGLFGPVKRIFPPNTTFVKLDSP